MLSSEICIRIKPLSRYPKVKLLTVFGKANLLKVLGNMGTFLLESQLLRGIKKYITLGVFREIKMKLLFRLGKANLLERV